MNRTAKCFCVGCMAVAGATHIIPHHPSEEDKKQSPPARCSHEPVHLEDEHHPSQITTGMMITSNVTTPGQINMPTVFLGTNQYSFPTPTSGKWLTSLKTG